MRRAVARLIPGKPARALPSVNSSTYRLDHGSVDEFYIVLDDPHKLWAPGEEILGQVILRSRKHLANIAITFNLAGHVKIHALPHLKLRPMKTVLFSHTIQIYGPKPGLQPGPEFANGLYKGEHRFPFIVKLPNRRIFTSIDFGKGAIVYVLLTHLQSADTTAISTPLGSKVTPAASAANSAKNNPAPGAKEHELSSLLRAKEALAKIHHPTFLYEKIISLVNPVDVAHLPPPKRKQLVIKNPRKGKLLRVQSLSLTINTYATLSSANSDLESVTNTNTNINMNTNATSMPGLAANVALDVPVALPASQHTAVSPSVPGSPGLQTLLPKPDVIRVLMDIAQRGYLRGELIPIKIAINHLRKIQDLTGIIVTLVRVCRIDYGPDGYYESFRKDLQQLVIPLFVDPATFSLEISTSVRVPPDAFPTISGCPLVSFQYFIEVMLNLSGKSLSLTTPSEQPKLSNQDDQGLSPGQPAPSNYNFQSLAHSRSEYINTDKFKRLKKFLQMTTEVVIGTHRLIKPNTEDSSMALHANDASQAASLHSQTHSPAAGPGGAGPTGLAINTVPELAQMDTFDSPPYLYEPAPQQDQTGSSSSRPIPAYTDVAISPPDPELPVMTEKERMQQHEASLLPSAPPMDDSESEAETGDDHVDALLDQPERDLDGLEEAPGASTSAQENDFARPTEIPGSHDMSNDDLYEAPDIHEGIGLEGAAEYVPNYDSAANDRLVDSNQ
ncbi:Arrestin (or S-antigen), N-terminal domain [Metschnikowia aff. pulcherrima]|uniref:pH-response regulator protein palF/RIM8 n=1 Tax=Metschnikowia aff. pulcherrima TaxID=2163413 RepID=A0A4P6XTF3_9ASCO|nr:Arrestin (or S-antigen), N-terminal domain [Metschnikowia aff. pulcherrima]